MHVSKWHVNRAGVTAGPVDESELRQLVSAGELARTDLVWREGMPNWVAAGTVPELFTGPPPPPPPPPPRDEFVAMYHAALKYSIPATLLGLVGSLLPTQLAVVAHVGSLVLMLVLSNLLLYRVWALIQDGVARVTPGRAIGYRFIPFFHFYWELVAVKGLAEDLNAYARRKEIAAPPVSTELAAWYCGLFVVGEVAPLLMCFLPDGEWLSGLLGLPATVLLLILLHQLAHSASAIAAAQGRAQRPIPEAVAVLVRGMDLVERFGKLGDSKREKQEV